MKRYCTELNSNRAREHMIYQKTTYLAETNDYGSDVNAIEVKQDDLNITTRAMNYLPTDGAFINICCVEHVITHLVKTGYR